MRRSRVVLLALTAFGTALSARGVVAQAQTAAPAPLTAIRAGRLLDPEAGRILTNQMILVEGKRIRDVGAERRDPSRRAGDRPVER